MAKYIEKRKQGWYAVLDVPKGIRTIIGKNRYVRSLQTQSKREAERMVLSVIDGWKSEFEAAKKGTSIPLEKLATQYRKDLDKVKRADAQTPAHLKHGVETELSIHYDLLDDMVREIAEDSPEQATRFGEIVKGETIALDAHLEPWLSELDNTPKTIDMKRHDVVMFLATHKYSHEIQKKAVQRWAYNHQTSNGLKDGTMVRIISACKGFWDHLQVTGIIERDDNPFVGVLSKQRTKNKPKNTSSRQPFSPIQVIELRDAALSKGDTALYNLIYIAMWTGCRIEEICSLRVAQVHGDFFEVADAKTDAGNRNVPIHSKLSHLLRRLCSESTDGFVLSELKPNKYGDRSNAVGKRFGRLKSENGYGKQLVFHSIRKTVATLLENAGVAENVSADILGHEKQTMTYGLYSGGAGLPQMNEAIQKIDYPESGPVR